MIGLSLAGRVEGRAAELASAATELGNLKSE
jgi:hypothetical protein